MLNFESHDVFHILRSHMIMFVWDQTNLEVALCLVKIVHQAESNSYLIQAVYSDLLSSHIIDSSRGFLSLGIAHHLKVIAGLSVLFLTSYNPIKASFTLIWFITQKFYSVTKRMIDRVACQNDSNILNLQHWKLHYRTGTYKCLFEPVNRQLIISISCVHDAVYEEYLWGTLLLTDHLRGMRRHRLSHHVW